MKNQFFQYFFYLQILLSVKINVFLNTISVFLHKDTATKLETSPPGEMAEFEANYTITDESATTLIISVKVGMHSW